MTELLKRKYITNGMFVSIVCRYLKDNYPYFVVRMGYVDSAYDSDDYAVFSIVIHENMNVEYIYADLKRFIQSFHIWNNEYISRDKYDKVCSEMNDLKGKISPLSKGNM